MRNTTNLIEHLLKIDKEELCNKMNISYTEITLDNEFNELIINLCQALLDTDNIKFLLMAINFKSLKLLKTLLKAKVKLNQDNYYSYERLNIHYYAFLEDEYIIIPDDLKNKLIKIINNAFFQIIIK